MTPDPAAVTPATEHRVWQIAFDALSTQRSLWYRVSDHALQTERAAAMDMIRAAMLASGITSLHVPARYLSEDHGLVTVRPDGDGGVYIDVTERKS